MSDVVEVDSGSVTIEVVEAPPVVVEVVAEMVSVVEVAVPGPQGPPGVPGDNGTLVFDQTTPLATWTFTHNLGRLPIATVYVDGEIVLVPLFADSTTITAMFPSPQTGTIIVN